MTYTELLRVRRALVVYTIIVAAIAAVAILAVLSAHTDAQVGRGFHGVAPQISLRAAMIDSFVRHHTTIPFSILCFSAFYGAMILASIFGSYLCRERDHTPLAWTKPASRERFALAYFGVDAIGILVAFLVTLVLGELVAIWVFGLGQFVRFDPGDVGSTLLLSGGMAFAYYGLVRAITVGFPGKSGAICGASWAIAFALIVLVAVPLPAVLHVIFVALDFLNPLAYLTQVGPRGEMIGAIDLSTSARIACVWLLAAISSVVAIVIYRRAEA